MAGSAAPLNERCAEFVKAELAGNDSSHDWFHIDRVRNTTLALAAREGLTGEIVETAELAALLHDLKDWKYSGDDDAGPAAAEEWLLAEGASAKTAELVKIFVASIGFKTELGGGCLADSLTGPERKAFEVVQDADRLDAIGAIGIARCFTFGGARSRVMHDPAVPPREGLTKAQYQSKADTTTINHFYEKLLTLKERMKSDAGKAVAGERHAFMERFLEQFHAEWAGSR